MSHLVSFKQIEGNLRRTASAGLISLLNQNQLEQLAFKYFGIKDEFGNYIGYECPYSGNVYKDYKDIVLEHIVPVSSKGGTVLFNCIPTSKEVNSAGQKGTKHLLRWWTNSSYWDKNAPFRLEKIVNYMLDGYEQVFNEYAMAEVESSYLEIETDESILDEEENPDLNAGRESELLEQTKNNGIYSYLGFIYDCIRTLERCNINTSSIKERLQQLQDQNIFKDIDKYQLYQKIIQKLIISRIGDDNHSYLTYTRHFDIKKLMDLINLDNEEDIYNELDSRLKNIEILLKGNNLSTIEYFKSLRDITDIDIIYKNITDILDNEIKVFLENIKLGIDTKIDIFIEMLTDKNYTSYEDGKPNKNNIFKGDNKIPFKDYESIEGLNTSYFWRNNSPKIRERLYYLARNSKSHEEREKYQKAIKAIEEYEFAKQENLEQRIDKFIEMLTDKKYTSYKDGKPNENNIFVALNKISFQGYESIEGLNTSQFWMSNSPEIRERLKYLESNSKSPEEKEKYQKVIRAIEEYEFANPRNAKQRIDKFIEMLTDKNYTSYEDGKPNKNNIFKGDNKIPFKDYESIEGLNTSQFWKRNSPEIRERLYYLARNSKSHEEREKYQKAIKAIEEYEFANPTNAKERIDKFIEMITDKNYTSYEDGKPNKNNIFKGDNKIPFKGYESIEGLNTSQFWMSNSPEIRERLYYLARNSKSPEEQEKYQKAKRAIEEYEFTTNLEQRIDCFIEMLTDKNYTSYEDGKPNKNNIFKGDNKIPFKGYESIEGLNTSQFWTHNSPEIRERLNYLARNSKSNEEREKYQKAKRAIEEYRFTTNLEQRIDCFIEMLTDKNYTSYEDGKPNKNNIFKKDNKIPFKDYESIEGLNTSLFWSDNSPEIRERLKYLESNSKSPKEKYEKAIRAIEEYEFAKKDNLEQRIDKFIEMLTDKKYTSYENGVPNKNNIFKKDNKIPFKDYESIEGLNTSLFWRNNSPEIRERLYYLARNSKSNEEREKYQKAKRAIEEYGFTTNLEQRIDCFIEMLTDKKYTSYKDGYPNENNIFKRDNKIPFKGYESIEGLNTSQFWTHNSSKKIIPLLFFNKQYDENNKVYIDSTKDYSIQEYDPARNAVLEYLKVKDINEYIDKLEQKEKKNAKVLELINLRNSLRKTLELLDLEEAELIEENNKLRNEYLHMQTGKETRRAV